jgi:small-conductance mechanosensitive channel
VTIWLKLFGHAPAWDVALGAIVVAVVAAWACAAVIASLVRRSFPQPDPHAEVVRHHDARATARIVWILLLLLLTALFIPPVLELFGEPLRVGLRLGTLVNWFFGSGLKVLLITVSAFVLKRAVDLGTNGLERRLVQEQGSLEHLKRARTLGNLTRNVATATITSLAGLYILQEFHFNLVPLLTGAGIAGLAIGFGAQTLVKDVISGFFLILEDQIRVGDNAEINGVGGLIETIHLRTVVLRDVRGAVHVFPCGSINSLANLTKDFSYAVLDLTVHYRHNTDDVIALIKATAEGLQQDPAFSPSLLGPIEVLGIESLGESGVTIRSRVKTLPQRQWDVARELRRRIKKAFDDKGIEIPFVQPAGRKIPN